jgi:hypothetical protein
MIEVIPMAIGVVVAVLAAVGKLFGMFSKENIKIAKDIEKILK